MENLGKPNQGGDVAPGVAMAPTEVMTEVSASSDPDPLAPKAISNGKTRFSSRDKEFHEQKIAAKQAKVKEKAAATPAGPAVEEVATQNVQAAPLGLNGDTKKKVKQKKVKGAAKERLQDKKAPEAAAPIAPTVNPNLGTGGGAPAAAAPTADSTSLPPASTPPGGAPPQGQPLSPTGVPATTPNGSAVPQP